MSWADVAKLVLAALFAGAATITITWLKSLWDEERALSDQFSDAVRDAAGLAAEYWLKAGDDPDLALLEAKLIGAQSYLNHFRLIATDYFDVGDRTWLLGSMVDLYDLMTSGDFKVKGRAAAPHRADDCQRIAAEIAIYVRSSRKRAMTISALVRRLFQRGS